MRWTRRERTILKVVSFLVSAGLGYHLIRFGRFMEPSLLKDIETDLFIGFTFYWTLPYLWKFVKWTFKKMGK